MVWLVNRWELVEHLSVGIEEPGKRLYKFFFSSFSFILLHKFLFIEPLAHLMIARKAYGIPCSFEDLIQYVPCFILDH